MTLLNPLMLAGVLAVAVPLVIHLRNRRQVRRVWWGAMRFLQTAVERNQQRLKLEDRLLLLVRCLAVALLAVVLARPAWTGSGGCGGDAGRRGPVTAVLVVDVSGSMQTTEQGQTRLELAREAARRWVDALPAGSRVALWTAGADVRPLLPEPTADLRLVRRQVDAIGPTELPSNLAPAVRQALAMLSRAADASRELLVITDGQRHAFAELEAIRAEVRAAATETRTTFMLVGEEAASNLAVVDLTPSADVVVAGRPVRLVARVAHLGRDSARDVRVVLRRSAGMPDGLGDPATGTARGETAGLPGTTSQAEATSQAEVTSWADAAVVDETVLDEIPPGQTRAVSLQARFPAPGLYAVTAEVAEVGAMGAAAASEGSPAGTDRVAFDDRRSLVLRVRPVVRVLLVEGAALAVPRDGEAFFLRQLWEGSGDTTGAFVRGEVVAADELDRVDLDRYDAVVLCGVAELTGREAGRLAGFVRSGGGLLVFPPTDRPPGQAWAELASRGVLPATAGERLDATARSGAGGAGPETAEPRLRWSTRHVAHLIVEPWSGADATELGRAGFVSGHRLEPTSAGRVVLRWTDGSAAAVEGDAGEGRVVVFGFAATTRAGDLPLRPGVFVPLAYRALGWATAGRDSAAGLNIRVGEVMTYALPAAWADAGEGAVEARVWPPGGTTATEAEGSASVAADVVFDAAGGRLRLQVSATERAGVYRFEAQTSASADESVTPRLAGMFAASADPSESQTERLTADERQSLGEVARVVEVGSVAAGSFSDGGGGFSRGGGESAAGWPAGAGREWFGVLAPLLLAVAAVEAVLAWRFSRPR
ncbi:MAG: BatA domain-containing protein [Tepidisphaerales bacterium]